MNIKFKQMNSYGSRRNSHSVSGPPVNYSAPDDYGGGPDYHTGRRYSQQQMDMGPVRRSPPQMEENMRRMSVHDYDQTPHRHSIGSNNGPGPDYGGGYQQQHQPPPPPAQQSGAYYEYNHQQQLQHHVS